MAGTVTHTYFSRDVYKKLDKDTESIINNSLDYFEIFNQGHDIFFFGGRKSKKLGNYFHDNKTQDFFINLIDYIRKNHLEHNSEVMAYLYGYICHYSLDKTIHPYVIYKSGYYYKKDKNTLKYNGKHNEMESYIDAYMINKHENVKPNTFDISKFCFKTNKISNEVVLLINSVFKETYNKKNMGKKYQKGLKKMKFLYNLLRNDKNGKKKRFYNFIDKKSPKNIMRFSPISLDYELNKNHYYLNLDKRKWCHPMYKKETYTFTFDDLYKKAIKEAIDLINASNAVLYYNKTTNYLKSYFTDISFSTGKKCSDNTKFKYFEF